VDEEVIQTQPRLVSRHFFASLAVAGLLALGWLLAAPPGVGAQTSGGATPDASPVGGAPAPAPDIVPGGSSSGGESTSPSQPSSPAPVAPSAPVTSTPTPTPTQPASPATTPPARIAPQTTPAPRPVRRAEKTHPKRSTRSRPAKPRQSLEPLVRPPFRLGIPLLTGRQPDGQDHTLIRLAAVALLLLALASASLLRFSRMAFEPRPRLWIDQLREGSTRMWDKRASAQTRGRSRSISRSGA
jgi:hypothetical protein